MTPSITEMLARPATEGPATEGPPTEGPVLQSLAPVPALQAPDRVWPLANCYMDLWIGLLPSWGLDPVAGLAFTVTQDFEGDQFTFFKYPHRDLEELYGVVVNEVSCYDGLENHALALLPQGAVILAEVDGWYLPDTRSTSYRFVHVKTTIGIVAMNAEEKRLTYFHANGLWVLEGDDYDGIFRRGAKFAAQEDILPPFVEVTYPRFKPARDRELVGLSLGQLRYHLTRIPAKNPFTAYAAALPRHIARLASSDELFFHVYAFHTTRQTGANFELLGSYLRWLELQGGLNLTVAVTLADTLAQGAKVLQVQLSRAAKGRGQEAPVRRAEQMAGEWTTLMRLLSTAYP